MFLITHTSCNFDRYLHTIATTENYIVIPETSFEANKCAEGPIFGNAIYNKNVSGRFFVIPRAFFDNGIENQEKLVPRKNPKTLRLMSAQVPTSMVVTCSQIDLSWRIPILR